MAQIIKFRERFKGQAGGKLYGECAACGCDEFHALMDEDENIKGLECYNCRDEYEFEELGIQFELE